MHVVLFPGWYPNRADAFSGDFIQRHARAISLNCRVSVVVPVKTAGIKKTEEVRHNSGNLTEIYYYYPSVSNIKWIDGLVSFIRYNYLCFRSAGLLSAVEKIALVHVYVLQKNQFIGLLLQWWYKIPYVVSEQSTAYVDGNWERLSLPAKKMARYAFLKAASFHAVSNYLLAAIGNKLRLPAKGVVIPNVVDTDRFYYKGSPANEKVVFVHVSNMVHQKNIVGMLQAFAEAKKTNDHFVLNLVGPATEATRQQIHDLDLAEQVVVWNERSYEEVAQIMQQSNVFVFFTRFETFGCVIIEANACGLPVIVTDLEVTRELINEELNGLFVQSEDVPDLASKIVAMISHPGRFDPVAISTATHSRFDYATISLQFLKWYNSVLHQEK